MTKRIRTAYLYGGQVRVTYEDGSEYSFDGGLGYEIENYTSTSIVMVHRRDAQRTVYDSEGHYLSSDYANDIARENFEKEQKQREEEYNRKTRTENSNHNNFSNETGSTGYEFGDFIGDIFNALEEHSKKKELERAQKEKERKIQKELNGNLQKNEKEKPNYCFSDIKNIIYKEFCEVLKEEFQRRNMPYKYQDSKFVLTYINENASVPATKDNKPLIEAGFKYESGDGIIFYADFNSYGMDKYKQFLKKVNDKMSYRMWYEIDFSNALTVRATEITFMDTLDVITLKSISDKKERKNTLLGKFIKFNKYIDLITASIKDVAKDFESEKSIAGPSIDENIADIWEKFYNEILEYGKNNWNITFRTPPDKSQILLDFNIGIDSDDATIGSIFVERQTDELGVICLYIAKMQNIDPKKSYFMSRHYNILPIKELIENFDKGFEKIIESINKYFKLIDLWKFFISTTKSRLEELSIQAKLTEDEISIICPLKKDIDMTTIAARIYLTSNEDCADCVECGIVKMDYDCQKQLKVLKKSMLTVFGTDFPTKEDFEKCIKKLTDWVQEQKDKYENQKF